MILRVSHPLGMLWGLKKGWKSGKREAVTVCGLRSSYKGRRRTRILSKESIHVIHALKLAKSTDQDRLLNTKLSRLLKPDALNLLDELIRQNLIHLSLKVFHFISEEVGDDRLLQLYADMILLLGRNKETQMAEDLFSQALEKGLKPDTRMCTEMIGAYLQVGMTDKAMQIYTSMKEQWACTPDNFTFTIFITNSHIIGQKHLQTLYQDCLHYLDSPHQFLQRFQQKQAKKSHADFL